jgi:5-methyltetrahydropteroyltriglutamate--homocysteine methyltransferase
VQPALLKTTVVGSYPQPDTLIDRTVLHTHLVPRARAQGLWRGDDSARNAAIREATLNAIRDMEAAGLDVVTDGEIARESYSNHFALSLSGIDAEQPALITSITGHEVRVPRVVRPIRHQGPVEHEWACFLRASTRRVTKLTLPGPFTLAQQVKDEFYRDPDALTLDFARALNEEAKLLETTGIDVLQLDEPWLRNDPIGARRIAVPAINRAFEGIKIRKAVHLCFGYAFLRPEKDFRTYDFLTELAASSVDEISIEAAQPRLDLEVLAQLAPKDVAVGVLDLSTQGAESADIVAARIRASLRWLPAERMLIAPDCGLKYMTRDVAFARLSAMVVAARRVRKELGEGI